MAHDTILHLTQNVRELGSLIFLIHQKRKVTYHSSTLNWQNVTKVFYRIHLCIHSFIHIPLGIYVYINAQRYMDKYIMYTYNMYIYTYIYI